MGSVLSWVVLGIGLAGAAVGMIVGYRGGTASAKARDACIAATIAAVGTIILFLVTLPSQPPVFALGQRLGYGILIGGFLGSLAGAFSARVRVAGPWASSMVAVGTAGLALLGVSLSLLIFRSYPQPALGGFLIGAILSSVIFRLTTDGDIDLWAITSVTLGSAVMLAVARYGTSTSRIWWQAPLLVAAAVIVATIASVGLGRRERGLFAPALVAAVLVIGLTAIFAWRLFPNWHLLWVAVAGIATFALVAWLGTSASQSPSASAGAALVVIAFAAVGFKLMAGFGIAIGMIAAWALLLPTFASTWQSETEEGRSPALKAIVSAMYIGVGMLLLRLFLTNYSAELRGVDIRDHYTFVTLALGAVLPFVLASVLPNARGVGGKAVGALVLGVLVAALPLLIVIIWGFKAALGFLIGSVVAQVFVLLTDAGAVKVGERTYGIVAPLVIAAQVSAVQLSGVVAPLAESTRPVKVCVLAAVVLLGLIWALASSLMARRAAGEA